MANAYRKASFEIVARPDVVSNEQELGNIMIEALRSEGFNIQVS